MRKLRAGLSKIGLAIVALIAVFAAVGCGRNDDVPSLEVRLGSQRVQAVQGVTNWTFNDGRAVSFDSAHSLHLFRDAYEAITIVLLEGVSEIIFDFSLTPDEVSVIRWNEADLPALQGWFDVGEIPYERLVVDGDGAIRIFDDGYNYIYEVHAVWEQGWSLFTFRTQSEGGRAMLAPAGEFPYLYVLFGGEQRVRASVGFAEWAFDDGSTIFLDEEHQLGWRGLVDTNTVVLSEHFSGVTLQFSQPPQNVVVRQWWENQIPADVLLAAQWQDILEFPSYSFTAHQNEVVFISNNGYSAIFEVIATWEFGVVHFAFRTQSTVDNPFAAAVIEYFEGALSPELNVANWVDVDGNGTLGVLAVRNEPTEHEWGFPMGRVFYLHDGRLHYADVGPQDMGYHSGTGLEGRLINFMSDGGHSSYTFFAIVDGDLVPDFTLYRYPADAYNNFYYYIFDGGFENWDERRNLTLTEFNELRNKYLPQWTAVFRAWDDETADILRFNVFQ